MESNTHTITFEKAYAEIYQFDNGTEVKEFHAMIHVSEPGLPFANQLEAVLNAYNSLVEEKAAWCTGCFQTLFPQ